MKKIENLDEYHVYTTYVAPNVIGQTESNVSGVTYSTSIYSDPYYVASCPELSLYATGSSRSDAYNALEGMTASISGYDFTLSGSKTW